MDIIRSNVNPWHYATRCSCDIQCLRCIDNGAIITDTMDIATKFNNYLTHIGESITQGIRHKGSKRHLLFNTITCPQNNSCGFDGISIKSLKLIEPVILK